MMIHSPQKTKTPRALFILVLAVSAFADARECCSLHLRLYNIQETDVVSRQKGADADGSGVEKKKVCQFCILSIQVC